MSSKRTRRRYTAEFKADSTSKEVEATKRSCIMRVVNNMGDTIESVLATHTSGQNDTTITVAKMLEGDVSPQKTVSYETGWWADFYYWQASFKKDGSVYVTDNNDRCNLEFKDAGRWFRVS